MKDGIGFSIVLRGQLPAQSQAGTKGEMVSAEESPGSSHLVPDHEAFCLSWGHSSLLTNPLW